MTMAAPADIVCLAIQHGTNESFRLDLPLQLAETEALTIAALAGAEAQLRLKGKSPAQEPVELIFKGTRCRIEGAAIVLEAAPSFFAGKAGVYPGGQLTLRLGSGFTFVSHEVDLQLDEGMEWSP